MSSLRGRVGTFERMGRSEETLGGALAEKRKTIAGAKRFEEKNMRRLRLRKSSENKDCFRFLSFEKTCSISKMDQEHQDVGFNCYFPRGRPPFGFLFRMQKGSHRWRRTSTWHRKMLPSGCVLGPWEVELLRTTGIQQGNRKCMKIFKFMFVQKGCLESLSVTMFRKLLIWRIWEHLTFVAVFGGLYLLKTK